MRYISQAPLLWFAREAAQAAGWSVLELDERAPEDGSQFEWMRGRARAALDEAGAEHVVVLGKSLGSAAAPLVAAGRAIWLTPLLIRPEIVEALAAADRAGAARGQPGRPDLGRRRRSRTTRRSRCSSYRASTTRFRSAGDPRASLDVLGRVTERVGAFLAALP